MKKIYIKIVCILCMIWGFSLNTNAQWRFGLEGGGGIHPAYHYDLMDSILVRTIRAVLCIRLIL